MGKRGIRKNELLVDGILLVDKPQDWTSHDVCAFVRKRYRIRKVGHAGTLDPMATGLLVVLVGRATKESNRLMGCDKHYEGIMELGLQTDSHDRTGKVLDEASWDHIKLEDIRKASESYTGTIIQTPPMVSALKHKGVRLYKLARQGREVEREGREVTVHSFEIKGMDGPHVSFEASVSKGTYVRTLIHDLGNALGCFATLSALRRVQCGDFHVSKSLSIETLRNTEPQDLREKILPAGPHAYTQ